MLPGWEDDVNGDRSQMAEESGSGVDFGSCFWLVGEVGDGVVLAGNPAFTARSSCMPAGVPGFMAYGGADEPIYFVQTLKMVWMVVPEHARERIDDAFSTVPRGIPRRVSN
jgi:hypothetical protein